MMHPKLWWQYDGPQTRQHLNQSFRQQYLLVMATVSVKRFCVSTIIPFALAAATGGVVGCLAVEPTGPSEAPVASVPDPTLLPVARGQAEFGRLPGAQPPQPAGRLLVHGPRDRSQGVEGHEQHVPTTNNDAGRDYSDGPNEVSLGWGPSNNTHTILIRGDGMAYYLVDFTRGWGFSNYRALPAAAQPGMDLRFSFSSVAGQERIAYVINGGQLKRFNTATMRVENTGNFPLSTVLDGWLQQDRNDEWFVGLADPQTAFAWNSQTNQLLTHSESWLTNPAWSATDATSP